MPRRGASHLLEEEEDGCGLRRSGCGVLRSLLMVEEDVVVDEGLVLARWSMVPRGLPVIEVLMFERSMVLPKGLPVQVILLSEEGSAVEEDLSLREGLVYGEVLVDRASSRCLARAA